MLTQKRINDPTNSLLSQKLNEIQGNKEKKPISMYYYREDFFLNRQFNLFRITWNDWKMITKKTKVILKYID